MLAKEMILPCPEWAQKDKIDKIMEQQSEDVAGYIFGHLRPAKDFLLNALHEQPPQRRGRKRRAYFIEED